MSISAAPAFRSLSSMSSCGDEDYDLDECFVSLWHYNYVLSPPCLRTGLVPRSQPLVVFSDASPVDTVIGHTSLMDQDPVPRDGFPLSMSMHQVYPLFQMLDTNNDGKVSLDDIKCVLRRLGKEVSESCVMSLMEPLVHNGEMVVGFSEFTFLYQAICSAKLNDQGTLEEGTQPSYPDLDCDDLLDTFNVYDRNRDGYISADELAEVLRGLGLPEGEKLEKCQTLIDRVDSDGNGLVDLREFKELLHRRCGMAEARDAQ